MEWLELEARTKLALYKVLGSEEHLCEAQDIAFTLGMCSASQDPEIPIRRPSPLIEQEEILMSEWKKGRVDGITVQLEQIFYRPCRCEAETNYFCGNHDVKALKKKCANEAQKYIHNFI